MDIYFFVTHMKKQGWMTSDDLFGKMGVSNTREVGRT